MLESLKPPVKILPCKLRTILDGLTDSDQEILMEALLDRDGWKDHVLAAEMSKLGLQVSANSVRKHRLYECSCRHIG